jgi:predicted DNA-binding transcriptional regulator YafY
LSHQDLGTLNEVLGVLKQFKGFGYFQELTSMVTKLEDKLYKQKNKGRSYIDFEKNELLKGLEFIDPLHKAIINKTSLHLTYQSFKAIKSNEIIFFPYLLKEYRNRWFVLGSNKKARGILNLALDRIVEMKELNSEKYLENKTIDISTYYNDVIGVTKTTGQRPQTIVMKIDKANAPYVKTKPLHSSQEILKEDSDGMIFSINVVWNYELERELLGFGEQLHVLAPKRLVGTIQSRLKNSLKKYQRTND